MSTADKAHEVSKEARDKEPTAPSTDPGAQEKEDGGPTPERAGLPNEERRGLFRYHN